MSISGGQLILSGYLRKKSPKALVGLTLWQRRFFCLYENVLTYSKDKSELWKNQGAIPVHEMVCVEQSRKDQCRFEIVITGRIFSLLANDANEAKEWLTALTSQIGHRRKYNAPRARSNSDPKVEKYWKHPESVLDDLHSPKQPSSAQSRSNAFTKVELSQLPSLSSFSNQSGIKRLTVIRPDDSITLVSQHTPVISNDVRSSLATSALERRFDINDMHIEKTLGQGVFGDIVLVVYSPNGERFMMQKVTGSLKTASMAIDAMRRISSFNNPYIMQCLDYDISPYFSWAVYEYVQGGQLFVHLRSLRRLSEEVTRFFVAEIVHTVNYLHRRGSIFRNMDPEHIALDSAGHVVITDFRIALDANNNDQPCRNPEYRTPEYLNGQREGSEADWWRLGVLIYELLVGFPPFRDQDPTELNNKILSVSIRYPPFVSTAACDIISKLIEVDINKRLGCGRNGFSEIIQHQFFADVNWSLVDRRNQPVPPIVLQCIESIDKGKPA